MIVNTNSTGGSTAFSRAALVTIVVIAFFCVAAGAAEKAPDWVQNSKKVYPEQDWLCVVESGPSKQRAQNAAYAGLSQIFRIDVASESQAYERVAQVAAGSGDKKIAALTESTTGFASSVNAATDVKGLMGVVNDFYTAPDGTWYATARMNRKESAARYSAMIRENDSVITALQGEAAAHPGTFDAYESLAFARDLAAVTDNFLSMVSVIDPNAKAGVSYGNAAALKTLLQNAARSIVVTITVADDWEGGRIAKAFAKVFSDRGFRTKSAGSDTPYVLRAECVLERVDLPSQTNKFARYIITAALTDAGGDEVFSWSGTDRQGHVTLNEAVQRALRAADRSITDSSEEEGFAAEFDAYLESLLK